MVCGNGGENMSESCPLPSRTSRSLWKEPGMTNTPQNSWHSRQRVMHVIIKIAAECWGSREEAKVNARWGDWGKVHNWTGHWELCVGKWMGFQNTELNERVWQHEGISLEHLSAGGGSYPNSAVNILQGCFPWYCVWPLYPELGFAEFVCLFCP